MSLKIALPGAIDPAITGHRSLAYWAAVVVNFDEPIDKEVCRDCDVCTRFCPTGALSKPREVGEEKKGEALFISG